MFNMKFSHVVLFSFVAGFFLFSLFPLNVEHHQSKHVDVAKNCKRSSEDDDDFEDLVYWIPTLFTN